MQAKWNATPMTDKKQEAKQEPAETAHKNNKNPDVPKQGTVEHSDDGRLKENRDKGVHRGDKE